MSSSTTPAPPHLTAAQIAERLGASDALTGDPSHVVQGVASLVEAASTDLSFVRPGASMQDLADTRVGVLRAATDASLGAALPTHRAAAVIRVPDVDLAMAQAAAWFAPPDPVVEPGVHPQACVHPSATLGRGVCVGPFAFIGAGAALGDGCVLHSHAVVMDRTTLGRDCVLWPGATVRDNCTLGDRVVLHCHAIIGTDGFGYRPNPTDPAHPVGDPVSMVTTFNGATVLEDFVKLDNLVQVGHNCVLARGAILCGMVGVAGSCTIGAYAVIGAGAGLSDHVHVGAQVRIAGRSAVITDVPAGEVWGGAPAVPIGEFRRQMIAIKRLPHIVKQLKSR